MGAAVVLSCNAAGLVSESAICAAIKLANRAGGDGIIPMNNVSGSKRQNFYRISTVFFRVLQFSKYGIWQRTRENSDDENHYAPPISTTRRKLHLFPPGKV